MEITRPRLRCFKENFGEVKPKNSSEEALQRWRKLCWVVKNPKRRFRFTANLSKRVEAREIQQSNQEKFRVAVLVSQAAINFIQENIRQTVILKRSSTLGVVHPVDPEFSPLPPQGMGESSSRQPTQLCDVRENNLTGQIPESIGNCTSFEILDISYNKITGEIPFNIGFLQVATL